MLFVDHEWKEMMMDMWFDRLRYEKMSALGVMLVMSVMTCSAQQRSIGGGDGAYMSAMLGAGIDHNADRAIEGSISYRSGRSIFSIRAIYIEPMDGAVGLVEGMHLEFMGEAGPLVGYRFPTSSGYVAPLAGISAATISQIHSRVVEAPGGFRRIDSTERTVVVGVAAEVRYMWTLSKTIGLGFVLFGHANTYRSYAGLTVQWEFGIGL